jgi:hypothetical protein
MAVLAFPTIFRLPHFLQWRDVFVLQMARMLFTEA